MLQPEVDVSRMFPDATSAIGTIEDGGILEIKLRYGDGSMTQFISLNIDAISPTLDRIRAIQSEAKRSSKTQK